VPVIYNGKFKHIILDNVYSHRGVAEKLLSFPSVGHFTALGSFASMGPFTYKGGFRFLMAPLCLYSTLHYHMAPYHLREAPTGGFSVCAGSATDWQKAKQRRPKTIATDGLNSVIESSPTMQNIIIETECTNCVCMIAILFNIIYYIIIIRHNSVNNLICYVRRFRVRDTLQFPNLIWGIWQVRARYGGQLPPPSGAAHDYT